MPIRAFIHIARILCVTLFLLSASAQAGDARGTLSVDTDKGIAEVYLGTKSLGDTPLTIDLDTGSYTIRVLKDGYEPFVRKIQIRAKTTTPVSARLFEGKGTVEFVVDPAGAKLSLNNKDDTWPTPVRLRDLDEGKYTYTLTAPGHETEKGKFTFKRGKNLLIARDLISSAGMVTVESRPSDALVILDGEQVGQTPLSLEDVPGGEHTVQLVKRGYATVFRCFDTSDGSKGEVEVRLPKRGVPLSVRTGNKASELSIEGMEFGPESSFRFGPVERGRYTLIISAPDRKTIEKSIDVPVTGTAIYKANLKPTGQPKASTLVKTQPFYRHWLFYTAIGTAAAAGTTTAILLASKGGGSSDSIPNGDILIKLP